MSEEGLVGWSAHVRVRCRKEVTAGHQWAWLLKKTETKTPSPCAVSGRAGAEAGLSPRPAAPELDGTALENDVRLRTLILHFQQNESEGGEKAPGVSFPLLPATTKRHFDQRQVL